MWHILKKLRESEENEPPASSCFSAPFLCAGLWSWVRQCWRHSPWTKSSQGTPSIYELGQPCTVPSPDPEATCHTVTDWTQRLAHVSHASHLFSLLLLLSCFFFFFLFPSPCFFLCLFIYLNKANAFQRPIPLFSLQYNVPLALGPQPILQGLGLCCQSNAENGTSQSQDEARGLCAQAVGDRVSWASSECHIPEFCLVNLSNFPFQLLWMFWEKLELGAVAFRVFPWVIIPNLRLQKESRVKQLWR